jgi:adenylate cyclase
MPSRDQAAADEPAPEHRELLGLLQAEGLSDHEIAQARQDGRLPTLAVDLALGGPPQHTLTAVARESGVDRDFLRRLLRAAGRPLPAPRERVFSDDDVELARMIARLLEGGLPRDGLVEVVRVLGQGLQQGADAARRVAGDALMEPGDSAEQVALRFAQAARRLEPVAAPLLAALFKAHLRDGIRNALITDAERAEGRLAGTRDMGIAFADLVDFTRLGERVAPEDLGWIAARFDDMALDAVQRPAHLVKTIGDAAMFVSDDLSALLDTVRELHAAIGRQEEVPDMRVGIAFGPATLRGGDWFGAPVNAASRVTAVAQPGQIVATAAFRKRTDTAGWQRVRRKRRLPGVEGRQRLYRLDPAG